MKTRRYTELRRLETFFERFEYLSLKGVVGESTFGFDRWLNQQFYKSREWREARSFVIARDNGCDLGFSGYDVYHNPLVHHMNPLTSEAIQNGDSWIIDPEYLITVSHKTHNAIHYGDAGLLPREPIVRQPGDTKLW